MKRIFLILFCINLFAQQTKLPMNVSEVLSLENPTYTVPAGYILQTLPLGTEVDPLDGSTQPGTVGVNDGVSSGWWSLEKIILTEGHKISSSISAGALLYDLGSLKANVKAFKVLWYDESYTIPENTAAEIYSVYSAGINGNPDESTFRKANETEDKALIEGMILSEGTSIKSWGVISIIEYYENYSNNEIGVLSFVPEVGNVGVRLTSVNANLYGDIGNNAIDLTFSNNDVSSGATGDFSVALGENTTASGNHSTAVGYNSNATGTYSVAIGATNNSYGYASTTFGDSNLATGRASTAIGAGTIAEDYGMLSIGVWSSPLSQPNPDQFSYNNTALLIGNGPDADNRSNALQVLFDGTTTIAGDLNVNSDARLKANIVSLGGTLAKLLQIDGKSYTMKKDESEKQKIGLLAQDIEKVFPELVSESNGIKSVNYQGLVPVLINALKEQDVLMKEQQSVLTEQQSELDELKSMMKKIIERQ